MSTVDPKALYEKLIQGKTHPRKLAGLATIHEICIQRFEAKGTDWGINSIGREAEKRGGPTAATLHQPRQEYYRALIQAWQKYAEAAHPAAKRKAISSADDWINEIENVSSRQMVFALKGELARVIDEVKLLKRLVANGGVLEIPRVAADHASSDKPSIVVNASGERSSKRFVEGLLQNKEQLAEMGLSLTRRGDLAAASTGEVVIEAAAIDLLRAAAKLF